jgi:lactobin A/cerein 7B family class IIb bacteriocin
MNQFVKTPVTLNEACGTRMLTDEELDEVNGGMGLVALAILLTAAGVAGVCVGIALRTPASTAPSGGPKLGDYPTGSNGTVHA